MFAKKSLFKRQWLNYALVFCVIFIMSGLSVLFLNVNIVQSGGASGINSTAVSQDVSESQKTKALESYGKSPLAFVENKGQFDKEVSFSATIGKGSLFFTQDKAIISLDDYVLFLNFMGANSAPIISGQDEQSGKVNYFIGGAEEDWKTGISTYGKIRYQGLYPGIDLFYEGGNNILKSTYVIAPNVDYKQIKLNYEGADKLSINESNGLEIHYNGGQLLTEKAPYVYQDINGERIEVKSSYKILDDNTYTFDLGEYNSDYALVIDPELTYSTFIGGSGNDQNINGFDVDSSGNAYVISKAVTGMPVVSGSSYGGGTSDVYVAKLNSTGSDLIYATYIGGSGYDQGWDVAVDSSGNAYITGHAASGFPTTNGAKDQTMGGATDAFAAKLSPSGSLLYSTYIGGSGSDGGKSIAIDASGNAYVTGFGSSGFPTTPGAYDESNNGGLDVFVTKVNSDGSDYIFSTLIGGSGTDSGYGIDIDGSGNVYVVNNVTYDSFPTTNSIISDRHDYSAGDMVVNKFNSTGTTLVYSTVIGGGGADQVKDIVVDDSGYAYITGVVGGYVGNSWSDFPMPEGAYCNHVGGNDVFVGKLNLTGSDFVYAACLGGNNNTGEMGQSIDIDSSGNAYITGATYGANFPTVAALDDSYNSGYDAFVAKINSDGSGLLYSSFFGGSGHDYGKGIVVDASGNVYVAGYAGWAFPSTSGAYDETHNGGSYDIFVAKFTFAAADETPPTTPGNLTLASTLQTGVLLNFGSASSDDNFSEYKIYYKEGSSGVSESDTAVTSASKSSLGNVNFNGASSVLLTGLSANTQYVFNIWAYDSAGNKASSTQELVVTTESTDIVEATYSNISTVMQNDTVAEHLDGYGSSASATSRMKIKKYLKNTKGNYQVDIPADTTMIAKNGSDEEITADFTEMALTTDTDTSDMPVIAVGAMSYGIPGKKIILDQAITLTMEVSSEYNGSTINVYRKSEGDLEWTQIDTCLVNSSQCVFSVTQLSDFGGGEGGGEGVPEFSTYVYLTTIIIAFGALYYSQRRESFGV